MDEINNIEFRNKVYRETLDKYLVLSESDTTGLGICYALHYAPSMDLLGFNLDIEDFPELVKHKPLKLIRQRSYWFWFPCSDRQSRIDILNQAIEESQ